MNKKVLIVGSGGREHALAWKMAQSKHVSTVFVAPGNGGTEEAFENVSISVDEIDKLVVFAKENSVDLTVVGPDDALAAGMVDAFQKEGLAVFGPTKKAALVESSKAFAKDFMSKFSVPTAKYQNFRDAQEALAYITEHPEPLVVKASGLALGKGAIVCQTRKEAEDAITKIMKEKAFGDAGTEVVIEEFLTGTEISTHAISDGESYVFLPSSQDNKPIGEGGTGLNTGGMGTIAPLPWVTDDMMQNIDTEIVARTIGGLKKHDHVFAGCLYPGLMMTEDGPKVIEFNARFGDPETQSYMRLLDSDLFELLHAGATGGLNNVSVTWKKGFACCIVIASGGYPEDYEKGKVITGIDKAEEDPDIVVFHAGTKHDGDNLVTSGGRVLGVSAYADTLEAALDKAYAAVDKIHFDKKYVRRDIGKEALEMEKE